jgi:saccharopine dehydrogenase-like NADP-dependent oxidoreductase
VKVVVLGAGMVGKAMVRDLASKGEFRVLAADVSPEALEPLKDVPGVSTVLADLSSPREIAGIVRGADIAVGAVPGFMGYRTTEAVIEAGVDIVDISFFPEDFQGLDALAKRKGVRCLVDFGVAPGCSNLLCGHAAETFGRMDSFLCMVGGLPQERRLPWEYQAPFSPADVIEEYTRTARIVRGGKVVSLPPLTEPELVDFDGVGTLEAFLTDGLRSLLRMEGVPEMVEKTLRYPGYIDKVKLLAGSGFLSTEPIRVGGADVVPLDLTSRLLFDAWKQGPSDRDFTVMRVVASGTDTSGMPLRVSWDMLDRYDVITGTSSMARTTGYTCTAAVRMLASRLWTEQGARPPEAVGRNRPCFEFIMAELRSRRIDYRRTEG